MTSTLGRLYWLSQSMSFIHQTRLGFFIRCVHKHSQYDVTSILHPHHRW